MGTDGQNAAPGKTAVGEGSRTGDAGAGCGFGRLAPGLGVGVALAVGVGVALAVGVGVALAVGVGVALAVGVGVALAVGVGVLRVGVALAVGVGVLRVGVALAVGVALGVGAGLALEVGVALGVGVGVAAERAATFANAEPCMLANSPQPRRPPAATPATTRTRADHMSATYLRLSGVGRSRGGHDR